MANLWKRPSSEDFRVACGGGWSSGRGNIRSGRIERSCSIQVLRWRRTSMASEFGQLFLANRVWLGNDIVVGLAAVACRGAEHVVGRANFVGGGASQWAYTWRQLAHRLT